MNTKPKTHAEYTNIIENHIIPSLANFEVSKLSSLTLQKYYGEKNLTLSAQTVTHHHRLISKVLNDAVGWEILPRNIAKGAKPPRPEKIQMETLNADELKLLLKVAERVAPIYYPCILTAVNTGMRVSEIIGLRWEDIDFNTNKILIRQTITHSGGKYFINNAPKNGDQSPWRKTTSKLCKNSRKNFKRKKGCLGIVIIRKTWFIAIQEETL